MKLISLFFLFFPTTVLACSFSNSYTHNFIYLALVIFFTGISLRILFDSLPKKKTEITVITLLLQAIPLYLLYKNWDAFYPCGSNLDFYLIITFLFSLVVAIVSIIIVLGNFVKNRNKTTSENASVSQLVSAKNENNET